MTIKSGIDIVYLPRFRASLKRGGENFIRRVFHEQELKPRSHLRGGLAWHPKVHLEGETTHLAGIFAAKEAVIKALSLPVGSWHDIHISYQSSGAPKVQLSNVNCQLSNVSLSISHDGNYVIAQFVAILKA